MPTTAFLAGTDSNDVELSYALETTYGDAPAGSYQKFRVNSESFSEQKNRTRPPELRSDGQAAAQTTQDVQARGSVPFGISYGNVDQLIACALHGAWSADLAIAATDIQAVEDSDGDYFEAVSPTRFQDIEIGQWIKVAGFTSAANNGYHRVTDKDTDARIVVASALANEAAGDSVTVKGSMLRNGTIVNTVTIQKRLATALGFAYPGTFFTGGQINAQRGQFFSGQLDALCKSETKAAAALGSGFLAAPTAKVMNTVGHFQSLTIDDVETTSKIMGLNTSFVRDGAALAFALGSADAVGIGSKGTLTVTGTKRVYFADYALYDAYKAETELLDSYRVVDTAGNAYIVTIPSLVLGQSTIVAGGPNQAVMADFNWGADPNSLYGCTLQLDRFAA